MAFPHDQDGAGNIQSLRRAVWYDGSSKYQGAAGGRTYHSEYNWDDPAGWGPRINYHRWNEQKPFLPAGVANGDLRYEQHGPSYSAPRGALTALDRKNSTGGISVNNTTAYVIKLTNETGNSANEVFTTPYTSMTVSHALTETPPDATWYLSWYGKKGTGIAHNGTINQTIYIFGLNGANTSNLIHNFSGYGSGGNAIGRTPDNPKTGGTLYYAKTLLTSSWQKFETCITFNGDTNITHLGIRLDNDNGVTGGNTDVYFDRITLHPLNIGLEASIADSGTVPDKMSAMFYGTYFVP